MSVDSDSVSSAVRRLSILVRGLAFWVAIVLPMLYLPLLLVTPSRIVEPTVLGPLVLVNALAIVVGHGYDGEVGEEFGNRR